MRLRPRALHLLLAALAVNALAAGSAWGTVSGHFTSSSSHAILKGFEEAPSHKLEFSVPSASFKIVCKSTSYSGTSSATTATQLAITPTLSQCETTTGEAVTVTMNGCGFLLTSGPASGDSTVHLTCSTGLSIELHMGNCTMRIVPQTPAGGVAYETATENGTHSLTVKATLSSVATQFEGGVCVFLGTNQTGTLEGAATLIGTDTEGKAVDLTATG